jgi:hypothetical protein
MRAHEVLAALSCFVSELNAQNLVEFGARQRLSLHACHFDKKIRLALLGETLSTHLPVVRFGTAVWA